MMQPIDPKDALRASVRRAQERYEDDADFFDTEVAAEGTPRATRGPKKAASRPTIETENLAA